MPDSAPSTPKKRGPKTPEGKARSSMNALKHGLRSKRFLLLPEEDPEDFASLVADIRAAYGPEDAVECAQVEAIAVAMWREIRADRVETEVMAGQPSRHEGPRPRHRPLRTRGARRADHGAALPHPRADGDEARHRPLLVPPEGASGRAARARGRGGRGYEAPAGEAAALCTNEFPAEPAPPPSAPEPAPAAATEACTNEFEPAAVTAEPSCTNEFEGTEPAAAEQSADNTVTLLSTYRALKKQSAGDAWFWLNQLTPEDMEKIKSAVANELERSRDRTGQPDLPGAS